MKNRKIAGLAVLLLLSVMMTAGLGAQELKFDGYINTGLGLVSDDNEDNDAYLKAFGIDAQHAGYRFRLNGSYANEAKNAGAKFRLQSQTNSSAGYFSIPHAFGWVNFLENKISVNGGIVEDNSWQTGDFWLASDSVSHFVGLGALLKLTPLDGLVLGAGFYPMNRQSGSSNNVLANLPALGSNMVYDKANYTLHGAYTVKDKFRLGTSYRFKNEAGGGDSQQSSVLYGEFRFLGVKNLTAVAAGRLDFVGEDFDEKGNIIISETLAYKASDALNLGLNAVQFLYNRMESGDKVDYDPGLFFNIWGSYTMDNIIPRLDIVYFNGGRSKLVNRGNTDAWDRYGFTAVAGKKDVDDDRSVFSVRPSVKINLDSKTFIEIGDMINFDSGNAEGVYKDSKDAKKSSRLTNAFYIDLKWSF